MTNIEVKASRNYTVSIESGLIDRIGNLSAEIIKPSKAVLVSGKDVYSLYGKRVEQSLHDSGFQVSSFVHCGGEAAKSITVLTQLLNHLGNAKLSRTDCIFALGGGVTGDLAGFAASIYQRGIQFFQIPTTLLAAVDSSVGGKTAINLDTGKNQAGTFWQPAGVFCDPETFRTLSDEIYRCGCAEIIKYALLGNANLFEILENGLIRDMEERVVAECVTMKRDIVFEDEFDTGVRRLLNLGHTFGHCIEKCTDYSVSHGDAVAIGMAIIVRAANKFGMLSEEHMARVLSLILKNGLPIETVCDAQSLYSVVMGDKKIASGKLNLVVPTSIGNTSILPIPISEALDWLNHGL